MKKIIISVILLNLLLISCFSAGSEHVSWGEVQGNVSNTNNAIVKFYLPDQPNDFLTQNVGPNGNGWVWAVSVEERQNSWNIGDDSIAIIDYEENSSSILHAGYYAVINDVLSSNASQQYLVVTLNPMASPNVEIVNLSVVVTWNSPIENIGNPITTNITAFNIYRSIDNVNFTLISSNINTTNYTDTEVVANTGYYYAIGYVYRGGVSSNYYSAGSYQTMSSNPPMSPVAIYPTDNLTGIAARATSFEVSFYTTENIDHDGVKFDIYFAEEGESLALVGEDLWTWAGGITGFDVGTVNPSTTYNWKVIAKDYDHPGVETEGPTFSFRTQEVGEIDSFEDGLVDKDLQWSPAGAQVITTDSSVDGSYGMSISNSAGDYYAGGASAPYWQNVSSYNYIALYIKNNTQYASKLSLKLTESDGDEWAYEDIVDWSDWVEINLPLDNFFKAGGSGDGIFDPPSANGSISQVLFNLLYADSNDFNNTIGYSVDKVRFMQTGSLVDSQPQIIRRTPSGNSYYAPLGSSIKMTFSEAMNKVSVESAFVISPNIAGRFSWLGNTLIFSPLSLLEANTIYTVSFNNTVMDLDGQLLAGSASWQFNTGGGGTGYNPSVLGWTPSGKDIPVNSTIMIAFSESIDESSVGAGDITIKNSSGQDVAGTSTWKDHLFVFAPSSALDSSEIYSITVNANVISDVDGDDLLTAFNWKFRTGTSSSGSAPSILMHSPVFTGGLSSRPTIDILFSESMNQNSATSNFVLDTNVDGVFSWEGNLMSFKPDGNFLGNMWHYVTLNATAQDSAGDTMVAVDVWKLQISADNIPPNAIADLALTKNGSSIVLSWTAPTDDISFSNELRYEIFRSITSDFSTSENVVSNFSGTQTTVTMAAGTTLNYYMVKAKDLDGNLAASSNYGYSILIPIKKQDGLGDLYWFSLPYNSNYVRASQITDEYSPSGETIQWIAKLDYATQSYTRREYLAGWSGDDFDLEPGIGYQVNVQSGDVTLNIVGTYLTTVTHNIVPNASSSDLYWLSLPYLTNYRKASDLTSALSPNGETIKWIAKFDYATQKFIRRHYQLGWTIDDFDIVPGEAYQINVQEGATIFTP